VEYKYILAFAAVMILPLIYYILIVAWKPRRVRERMQYLAGLAMYIFLGPFLNIIVLSYALWNIDNFAWGKTRKVIKEPEAETEKVTNSGAMQEIAP
jgi:chitin synthase